MASPRKPAELEMIEISRTFDTPKAGRIILVTRLQPDALLICVTDGKAVWRHSVPRKPADGANHLATISASLLNCDITVHPNECRLSCVGNTTEYKLLPIDSADDKSSELQRILFQLADRSACLEAKLKTAQSRVDTLQQKPSGQSVFDIGFESKKKKSQVAKGAPKQVGMSVVNPGSKKRSAPKGVEFDAG